MTNRKPGKNWLSIRTGLRLVQINDFAPAHSAPLHADITCFACSILINKQTLHQSPAHSPLTYLITTKCPRKLSRIVCIPEGPTSSLRRPTLSWRAPSKPPSKPMTPWKMITLKLATKHQPRKSKTDKKDQAPSRGVGRIEGLCY
jgi:hypothetical protein